MPRRGDGVLEDADDEAGERCVDAAFAGLEVVGDGQMPSPSSTSGCSYAISTRPPVSGRTPYSARTDSTPSMARSMSAGWKRYACLSRIGCGVPPPV
jgi:hypothetical protein